MQDLIERALTRFETLCDTWSQGNPFGTLVKLSSYVYLWAPPHDLPTLRAPKNIGLTLQAITHGNEVGGINTLIECLSLLKTGIVRPQITMAFVLGNPRGALANRRFLETDLNRAFHSKVQSLEGERARQLEGILIQSEYFLDFHQTIEPSLNPFFIFPYTPAGFAFARAAHNDVPIVTHWGKSFSLDGMCTDEFVNFKGGTGITIELGKKGFDPYQTGVGLHAALGAITYVQAKLSGPCEATESEGSCFTWKATELFEEGMDLKEGLTNFQLIMEGDVIGTHGKDLLMASASGYLLFPKYPRDPLAPRARELYRIIKKIDARDLGKPGVVGL
ncbi:MAG: succinylglutamate desuccinylase/aspartoacylase family protein [Chitinophagaceae bacterium]|nr:succinylglutamate desuccinylase/aspartoacylase family protein [Oligoflexus sp.]